MSGAILETRNLTIRFGGLTAVNDVSIQVRPGEIFSIIGPNGAGKTTVFNAVTGIYEPTTGQILFGGDEISRPFTRRTAIGLLLAGAFTGILTVLLFYLEGLWEAVVLNNNAPVGMSFPVFKALGDGFGYLFGGPRAGGAVLLLLAGAGLGAAGRFVVWRRTRRTPDFIASRGIARTFQNIRLFQEMTVLENVVVSLETKSKLPLWKMALRLPAVRDDERRRIGEGMKILEFVGLQGRYLEIAKNLPYGDQRRLEIARALALRPTLLLVDEPAAGMNPSETTQLMDLIRKIRDTGITVLVIEHHMRLVMGISDRIAVLDYGNRIAEGTPEEVRANPRVIEAYLGKEEVA